MPKRTAIRDTEAQPVPAIGYRIDTVAKMLDCSPRHVRHLIERGELAAVKIGGCTRVLEESVRTLPARAPRVAYASAA